MLGISRYDQKETASWLAEHKWSYPLLCDGAEVIKKYGLLNPGRQERPVDEGIPHPATVIIDEKGIIRFKQVWVDYKQRTRPETILKELDKIRE